MSVIAGDFMGLLILIPADRFYPFRGVGKFGNFLQNLYLIIGGIKIVGSRFHHLYCHVGPIFEILCKPHCREMPPAEFLNENIAIDKNLANMARMIPTNFIILDPLILTMVFIIEFPDPIPQIGGLFSIPFIIKLNFFNSIIIRIISCLTATTTGTVIIIITGMIE